MQTCRFAFIDKGGAERIKGRFQSLSHFLHDVVRAEALQRLDEDRGQMYNRAGAVRGFSAANVITS